MKRVILNLGRMSTDKSKPGSLLFSKSDIRKQVKIPDDKSGYPELSKPIIKIDNDKKPAKKERVDIFLL